MLGRALDSTQPRIAGPLPGVVRQPLPRLVSRLGAGIARGDPAAERAWAGLVRCQRDPDLRVAAGPASVGEPRPIRTGSPAVGRSSTRRSKQPRAQCPGLLFLRDTLEAARPAVVPAGALFTVVGAELVTVAGVRQPAVIELGRVLDLVLRPIDPHAMVAVVDATDDAGREHDLL